MCIEVTVYNVSVVVFETQCLRVTTLQELCNSMSLCSSPTHIVLHIFNDLLQVEFS